MSVCGHDCGCTTPCDKPVTLEELLDEIDAVGYISVMNPEYSEDVPVEDIIQRVKERRMGL